ncbi:MAG: hypothetical protein ACI90V_012005 [Bacillariaceae sp.]|jgi:hypothetical protein
MLDGVDQDRFDRLRYVEIKHGRKLIKLIHPFKTTIPCTCARERAVQERQKLRF